MTRQLLLYLIFLCGCIQTKHERLLSCHEVNAMSLEQRVILLQERYKISDSSSNHVYDSIYFCAFPNSFAEMEYMFGYTESHHGALNNDGQFYIDHFVEMKHPNEAEFYRKYIRLSVEGVWQGDHIRKAFGVAEVLLKNPEAICPYFNELSDAELRSVFRFMFDGPHPNEESIAWHQEHFISVFGDYRQRFEPILLQAIKDVYKNAQHYHN